MAADGTGYGTDGGAGVRGAASEAADRGRLIQLMFGHMAARVVYTAVEFGIVDRIGDTERTPDALARECGAQPQAMQRLLRALAALGLLAETAEGAFRVTDSGALLGTDRPDSVSAFVRMFGDPVMLRAWEQLGDSVRTGDTSFDTVFGTDFFSYLAQHPALSAQFNAAMSQGSHATAAALPDAYDFGRFSTVVDIGGGDGTLLAAILREHRALHGLVYDTAEGLAEAGATFERAGVSDRASAKTGDFFASVPTGDLHLLKSVIHDWNDQQCTGILRNCRDALPSDGRLLIVEPVLPATVGPDARAATYLSDLNMLINVGGRERTREDFAELCRAAGFSTPTFTQLPAPQVFWLIEAAPAP